MIHMVYTQKKEKAFIDVQNRIDSPPGLLAIPQKVISANINGSDLSKAQTTALTT